MTLSTDAAFLAAIASNPDDGLVRLVYADWLDEQGRAEADFLRTEHELTTVSPDQPRWHELFRRFQVIGHGLPAEWCAAVRRHPLDHWLRMSARGAWRRLERWCEQHHPRLLETLNPGATAEQIAEVEATIGRPLPADVRASFAIHNGEQDYTYFILGDRLLTLTEVTDQWNEWRGLEEMNDDMRDGMESWPAHAIQLDYANPGWISLTRDGGSCFLGVDLAPGVSGVVGQFINFGRDEEHKCVLASGWAEFLADFATFLESGVVTDVDPDPAVWVEVCKRATNGIHCHDKLREWRKEGRWPVRPTA